MIIAGSAAGYANYVESAASQESAGSAGSAGGVQNLPANDSKPVDNAENPVTFITFRNMVMQNIDLLFKSMKPGKIYECRLFKRLKQLHEKNTGHTLTDKEFLPCFASATLCHNRQFVQEPLNRYLPSDQFVQELRHDEPVLRLVKPPPATFAPNIYIAGVMRPAVFFENIPDTMHTALAPPTLQYSNTGVSVKTTKLQEIFLGEQIVAELDLLCLLTQSACKSAFLYTKDTFLPCLDWVDKAVDIAVFWVLYALRTRNGEMSGERINVTRNCNWSDDNEKRNSLQPQQLPEPFHEAILLMRQQSRLYAKHVRQVTRTMCVNDLQNTVIQGVYPLPVIKHCIKYNCRCALPDKTLGERCEIAKPSSGEVLFDRERTTADSANIKCLCAFWLGASDLQIQWADLNNYQQPCMQRCDQLQQLGLLDSTNFLDGNEPTAWVQQAMEEDHVFLGSYNDKCQCMKCDTASVWERVRDAYTAQHVIDNVAPAILNIGSVLAQHEMHACSEEESLDLVGKMLSHCKLTQKDKTFLHQLWSYQCTEIAGISQQNVPADVDFLIVAAENEIFELSICRAMFKLLRFYYSKMLEKMGSDLPDQDAFTKSIHSDSMQLACGNMFMFTICLKAGMQCMHMGHLGPTDFGDMNVFKAAESITHQPKPDLQSNTLDLDEHCLLQCYTSRKIVEVVLRSPMGIMQVCDGIMLYVKSQHHQQ